MQTKVIGVFAIEVPGVEFDIDSCPLMSVTIANVGYGPNAIWLGEFFDDVSAAGAGWRHDLLRLETDWESDELDPEQLVYDDRADAGPNPILRGADAERAYRTADVEEAWQLVRSGLRATFGRLRALSEDEVRDYSNDPFSSTVGVAAPTELDSSDD